MADFKIKPSAGTGNKLLVQSQDQSGSSYAIQVGDAGATTLTNATITAGTFPSGHVTNVFRFNITNGNEYSNTGTTEKISQTPISFTTVSGRHYSIINAISCWPYKTSTSANSVLHRSSLYYGTTSRAQGDTTFDTKLATNRIGRFVETNATHALNHYSVPTLIGSFTAGSSATHYVYITQVSANSSTITRTFANSDNPWNTTIMEVMP